MVRLGLVVADFNEEITAKMAEVARARADALEVEVADEVHVFGAYDTPLAAKRLLVRDDVDGVVVLGAVVTGETKHDEMIFAATAKTLQELALEFDKPVALGISGPGQTWDQAVERAEYAGNAVEAAVRLVEGPG